MGIKFANGGYATLASSITNSDTSITLTTGQGARFPSLSGGDYFYATLIDTSNNLEIVKCTARSTDVLTVTRAQESTTARAYSAGDRIELRITAQGLSDAAPVQSVAGKTGAVTLEAADIASGVFGTARLASSGTASSSTFLRGDQSWVKVGGVLQVKQTFKTDKYASGGTSGTWYSVTGLSVDITPSSSSNKILVMAHIWMGGANDTWGTCGYRVTANGSALPVGSSTGSYLDSAGGSELYGTGSGVGAAYTYLHAPGSTSTQTYQVQLGNNAADVVYVNGNARTESWSGNGVSSITVWELRGDIL